MSTKIDSATSKSTLANTQDQNVLQRTWDFCDSLIQVSIGVGAITWLNVAVLQYFLGNDVFCGAAATIMTAHVVILALATDDSKLLRT